MTLIMDQHHSEEPPWPADGHGRHLIDATTLLTTLQCVTRSAQVSPDLPTLLSDISQIGRGLGMLGGVVWAVEGDELRVVAHGGYGTPDIERFTVLPLTANLPASHTVLTRLPVVCRDRQEMFSHYPLIERLVGRTHALAAFPIEVDRAVVAGMSVHFRWPLAFDPPMMSFMTSVNHLVTASATRHLEPLADVVPLSIIRARRPGLDLDEPDHPPLSILGRLESLEHQMRNIRQVLTFLGAIASDRLDRDV